MVFIDIKTYMLTEDSNFKTFIKEKYATALEGYYIFCLKNVEHGTEYELIMLIEFAYIRNSIRQTLCIIH